jgi:hypothetical protein
LSSPEIISLAPADEGELFTRAQPGETTAFFLTQKNRAGKVKRKSS